MAPPQWTLLACLALAAVRPGGACVVELLVSAQNSVLDVSGTLGALIDIELQGLPPQAMGARCAALALMRTGTQAR